MKVLKIIALLVLPWIFLFLIQSQIDLGRGAGIPGFILVVVYVYFTGAYSNSIERWLDK